MKRVFSVIGMTLLFVLALGTAAFATSHTGADTAAVTAVSDGALSLKNTLIDIGENVLPYAAAIAALVVGWRFARRFVRA